ncbi:MAG: nitroreductase family protein [Thermoproteota archaeon]|nr:nitroreductase family protein [Thermoproteota archaeon]
MDVFEAIKNRRSVRAFTNQPVSEKQVHQLIDAARWAPSAGNVQSWEFIVVRNAETKRKLAEAALNQTFIEEAPVVIVVCANEVRSGQTYGDRGVNLYCLQDTAAATQNLLLTAYALGLAACWVGAFQEEEAKNVLNTPRGMRPVAIVPIGHPAEKPVAPSRRPLSEIVHYESFGRRK